MSLKVIVILFWLYSILGWIIETTYVSIIDKKLINRGFLIGPYCPIYGSGAILMLPFSLYKDESLIIFFIAIVVCSILEYLTSYVMEQIYKVRWWDYSDRFLNINGRVCLFNAVCFGFLGTLLVTILNPFFINLIDSLNLTTIKIIFYSISLITLIDISITFSIMFDIRESILNCKNKTLSNLFKSNKDNTENISKKVREILSEKKFVYKHLSKAFDTLKVYKHHFNKKIFKTKNEKMETSLLIGSLISIVIGFIIGKLIDKIGLTIIICFVIYLFIFKIINRGKNVK